MKAAILPDMSSSRSRAAEVLSRINSVLVVAGLNDNVWSVRDCDSTLFVLLFKKLFGKLPGVIASPVSPAQHARNFDVVLRAVASDVLSMDLGHISPDALARGDLQALYNLAEIFSELCEVLLKREDAALTGCGKSGVFTPRRMPHIYRNK